MIWFSVTIFPLPERNKKQTKIITVIVLHKNYTEWFLERIYKGFLVFLRLQISCLKIYQNQMFPSKHFNVVSTLFLGWYDVATSHNVKPTLKQRCVRQMLEFTTLNNVESTLSISTLIWTTLENVETMLGNIETTLWIWTLAKKVKIKPRVKNKKIFLSFKAPNKNQIELN